MSKVKLPNAQWQKIFAFLQQQEGIHLGKEAVRREFVGAGRGILRSGAPWRLLPAENGRWNAVYRRFRRWGRYRLWEKMRAWFSDDAEVNTLMGDSTVVRAPACAAGAPAPGQALPPPSSLGPLPWGIQYQNPFLSRWPRQAAPGVADPGPSGRFAASSAAV